MSGDGDRKHARIVPALITGVGGWYLYQYSGPVLVGSLINPLSALASSLILGSGSAILSDTLWWLGNVLDEQSALTPTGKKGTAGWVTSYDEIKHDLVEDGWGPYWGTFRDREIIATYGANAATIGISGAGKGIGIVMPSILSIRDSKICPDIKGELAAVLANALRARGETVHILNIGGIFPDILGETAFYNPLCIIADSFWRAGGLMDVSDDIFEICMQLAPEPAGENDNSDNSYFRIGSRELIGFAIQMCVLINGYNATLGDVAAMLNDIDSLLRHAKWACGKLEQSSDDEDTKFASMPIEDSPWSDIHSEEDLGNYIIYFRGLAIKVVKLLGSPDSRTAEPFMNGAQQSVARFNITTRSHRATSRTTMRFTETKEGDSATTIFIVSDASRNEAQKQVVSLLQFCMLLEIKRHANKSRLVYLIADEATNSKIYGLEELLTWARTAGLRFHLIFQNLPAFKAAYGESALSVLLSETEIKLFLPGTREPETLAMLEKMLGNEAHIALGRSGNIESPNYRITGLDYREDGRPLMFSDEIRRMNSAILFIRRNKPMQVELPPIAAIDPFRDVIDVNPYHGKKFLLPIVLRLRRDLPRRFVGARNLFNRVFNRRKSELYEKKMHLLKLVRLARHASTLINLWWVLLVIAFFASPEGPHLRWSYDYRQYGSSGSRSYLRCTYLGSRGMITPNFAPDCPLLVFIDSRVWR